MTALAQDYNQPLTEAATMVTHSVLYANTTIYAGTLAMNDAGVVKPFTSAGYVGGASLLGFPTTRLTETTGSNKSYAVGRSTLKFRKNCPFECASDASIAASYIGKPVFVQDNFTVSTTDTGSQLSVILLEILSSSRVVVKLP